ncbi:hypothetical protein RCL1_006207 [Eukaryota sp. TZLM3-RCL]
MNELLKEFPEVFDTNFPEEGIVTEPMPINFYDEQKICSQRPRPLYPRRLEIANQLFDSFIDSGIARESKEKFCSPIVLIEYKDKPPRIAGVSHC